MRAGLFVLTVRVKYLSESLAGITEVPAHCLSRNVERLGDFVVCEASGDTLHHLALRWRQVAEHVCDPPAVFQFGQLVVLKALLIRDMAAFDEPPGYPAGSACLGLDEIVDHCPARVSERVSRHWPAPEHLSQGLLGRILCFLKRGPGEHRGPD